MTPNSPNAHLPEIYNAVEVKSEHKGVTLDLVGEVQQHLGGNRVRIIALGSTDGMMRGMDVVDTGKPVSVPVGQATLGRVFNVLGQPIDKRGEVKADDYWPIHRQAPPVNELVDQHRSVRNRHQGGRLADAVRSRW